MPKDIASACTGRTFLESRTSSSPAGARSSLSMVASGTIMHVSGADASQAQDVTTGYLSYGRTSYEIGGLFTSSGQWVGQR